MSEPLESWPGFNDPPRVEVRRVGRWMYAISIHHQLMQYGPGGGSWYAFGRSHAERKAKRLLRRYVRRTEWQAEPLVISADGAA